MSTTPLWSVIVVRVNDERSPVVFRQQRVGSLASGVHVRAVEKNADFLLLEADADAAGAGGGTLGWADASCVVPVAFPAIYEFGSELPDAVRTR